MKALDERCDGFKTTIKNKDNELDICRELQLNLEKQLDNERGKVADLRNEKQELMAKVSQLFFTVFF